MFRARIWIVAALAVMLIVAHGLVLHYASSFLHLSLWLAVGLAVLILIKHFGLFGAACAKFRNHTRKHTGKVVR